MSRGLAARSVLVLLVVLGAYAASARRAHAYTPDPIHRELATAAIRSFNQCVAALQAGGAATAYRPIDAAGEARIVDADTAEDTSHWVRRSWNWHFYSQFRQPLWYFGIDRTLWRVYGEITSALERGGLPSEDEGRATGRAMHFLEDMTVPAHVVPVYHGPLWSDAIDKYEVGGLDERLAELLPVQCRALEERGWTFSLQAQLDQVALATRWRLTDKLCADAPATWHAFWIAPPRGDLFGSYADETFGVETEIEGCRVTRAQYDAFVLDGHVQAVLADVALLFRVRRTADPADAAAERAAGAAGREPAPAVNGGAAAPAS